MDELKRGQKDLARNECVRKFIKLTLLMNIEKYIYIT